MKIKNIKTIWMRLKRWHRIVLRITGVFLLLIFIHFTLIRPWMMYWGANDEETTMALPIDDYIPQSTASVFMTKAITIDAPPEEVWKWIVQIGTYRAGWYSHTWAENLFGLGVYNTYEIKPEWQSLEVGDTLLYCRHGFAQRIQGLEKNKYYYFGEDPANADFDGTDSMYFHPTDEYVKIKGWMSPDPEAVNSRAGMCFYLQELPDGRTRLINRVCEQRGQGLVRRITQFIFEAMDSTMAIEMLKQLKECAEGKKGPEDNHGYFFKTVYDS